MALLPLGLISQGVGAGGAAAFELISTTFGTGSSGTITFSSIPATYTHLQIRMTPRTDDANSIGNLSLRFNADTAANYSSHFIQGYGTGIYSSNAVSATSIALRDYVANGGVTYPHAAFIVDILDYKDINKNKTLRALQGLQVGSSNEVSLISGNWRSTSAITSITLSASAGSFIAASRFSLYGIRGA